MFKAPNKPGNSCTKVNAPGPSKGQCTTKHAKRCMPWWDGVLYEVPLACKCEANQGVPKSVSQGMFPLPPSWNWKQYGRALQSLQLLPTFKDH